MQKLSHGLSLLIFLLFNSGSLLFLYAFIWNVSS